MNEHEPSRDYRAHSTSSDIEVAEDFADDVEEAYFDEDDCSTESVRSSIYNYEKLHGRSFHAYHAGKYLLPNDDEEQDRIDIKYHGIRLCLGNQLFFAPIPNPMAVIDIGTGTGMWAIDMADAYPACEVIGTDLSPIQPTYVPANCQFEIADAEDEWTFRPKFDLVHTRIMNDTSLKDWPKFYRQAFTALKPGGWVESQEFSYTHLSDDNSIPRDSAITQWEELWTQGVQKIGLQGHCNPNLVESQMRDAGFINVTRRNFKFPIGPWPKDRGLKECGLYGYVNLNEGWYGLSVKVFTNLLGWSVDELEVLLARCRKELKRKDIHSYWRVWVIYGQKPENSRPTA